MTMRAFFLLTMLSLCVVTSDIVLAQSNTTTAAAAVNESTTAAAGSTSAPPGLSNETYTTAAAPTTIDPSLVGDGVYYESNITLHPEQSTCANLIAGLTHPELRQPGARTHAALCIPTPVKKWVLQNSTRSTNRKPSGRELLDCIATCSEEHSPRSATVSVIFMFQKCYCWSGGDFNARKEHNKECCKEDLLYEDYFLNREQKCLDEMMGNVYTTTLLCPINGSLCGAQPSSHTCETKDVAVDEYYYKENGLEQQHKGDGGDSDDNNNGGYVLPQARCCIPQGSMRSYSSWGMQVAQYTIVFICVLALFQVLYWILRKRREDEEEEGGGGGSSANRDQPRLLVVPMVSSSEASSPAGGSSSPATSPVTVTQAGRSDQQAIAASKEIIALFPIISSQQLTNLSGDDDSCSVCLDPLANSKAVKLPFCGHMFHYNCLLTYLAHKLRDRVRQVTCPMCRAVAVDATVNEDLGASPAASPSSSPTTSRAANSAPSSPATAAAAAASSSSPRSSRPRSGSRTGGDGRPPQRDQNPLQESLLGPALAVEMRSVDLPTGQRATRSSRNEARPEDDAGFVTSTLL